MLCLQITVKKLLKSEKLNTFRIKDVNVDVNFKVILMKFIRFLAMVVLNIEIVLTRLHL